MASKWASAASSGVASPRIGARVEGVLALVAQEALDAIAQVVHGRPVEDVLDHGVPIAVELLDGGGGRRDQGR